MLQRTDRKKYKYFEFSFLALIVTIFSFPEIDLSINVGIDPPLKWLFNYIFSNNLSLGENIIFPHGPLAFFMYPTAENFILTTLVTIVLQTAFVFHLLILVDGKKRLHWLLAALLAWIIFCLSNFNQLILSNISVTYLLYLKNGKRISKYCGFVLTAFAFYVKAYVAIISGTITFSLLAIDFFRTKNIKHSLTDIFIVPITMFLFWLFIYGKPGGFINYCIGMAHLAGDNSAAAAYYPNNNWLLIFPFLVVIASIPFFQRNDNGKIFGFLFSLSFFAGWKYGMAREDHFHLQIFLYFVISSMLLFLIYNYKNIIINTLILIFASILFIVNMKNVENHQPLSVNYSGIVNFITFVSDYSEIKKNSEKQNIENIASNRLPNSVRNQIGNATVDIYPWDYTIIAANQLNWKPRPVIQSYAAYTSWLDKKNADHFNSTEAPEFIILGLNNSTTDLNGGNLESIDNRYLLNDEPQTLIVLLKNYACFYSDENFIIYRKRKQMTEINSVITKTQRAQCNEWITVPDSAPHFTRIKLLLEQNFSGKLKSFFYKDELYYMYFMTSDSTVLKYRIVPQNAVDGIWISPFYTNAGGQSPAEKITRVMMVCSNKNKIRNPFYYEWEYFDATKKTMIAFLAKDSTSVNDEVYLNKSLNFRSGNSCWSGYDATNLMDDENNQRFYLIKPESFAPAYTIKADSVFKTPSRITVNCWVKSPPNAQSTLVIETENDNGQKNWQGTDINKQTIDQNETNHIFSFCEIKTPFRKANIYIWNNGKSPIMLYEMNIKMMTSR